jgi:hypothetical protein
MDKDVNFLDSYKCYYCDKVCNSFFNRKEHISYNHKLLFNPDINLIRKNIYNRIDEKTKGLEMVTEKILVLEKKILDLEKQILDLKTL